MPRLSASDAQMLWMSAKIPNDQFLLYCFEGATADVPEIREGILSRAAGQPRLQVAARDVPLTLDYPSWVPMQLSPEHVVAHRLSAGTWLACRTSVEDLITTAVDVHESPWRVHLFGPVVDAPACERSALVAVLQISHALVDGRGASELARALFDPRCGGPRRPPADRFVRFLPAVAAARFPAQAVALVRSGRAAHRAALKLADDTERGVVPAPAGGRRPLPTNARPGHRRSIRPIVCAASDLRRDGVTVTVGAMTAVSSALADHLRDQGHDVPGDLCAEALIGKPDTRSANNYRNAGVDLHPNVVDLVERARLIAGSMKQRRQRFAHPSFAAGDRASSHVPAALTKWGTRQFDENAVPDLVAGHTVVSSVNRGAADLVLGGGTVRWTAGFPALSPMMGLTHGVHGIGDTVTLTVVTSPDVVPDVDRYEALLREAVSNVARAFRSR